MKKSINNSRPALISSHLPKVQVKDRFEKHNRAVSLAVSADAFLKEPLSKTTKKEAVSVIGLGYVGLPLACLCAEKKYETYGIDSDFSKVELINKGISPIDDNQLKRELKKVKFTATTNTQVIRKTDIVVVCVPTPVNKKKHPDFQSLKMASQMIQKNLRRKHLIIIESTVNPGACNEIVQPILEKSGLKAGKDFDIAHCPERIDTGNTKWSIRNIPRVVGATSPRGLRTALSFYRSILEAEVLPMKSIKEAEATKILENTFRDINIAFVNELAMSFCELGIDIINVIKAASTKPFGFLSHYPGCGVGGHCIPVDPYYLIMSAKKNGFDHKLLRVARKINESMPAYTVELLIRELDNLNKPTRGANIGIMGLAYKANIEDTRESPAYKIIDLLKAGGANLNIYDPFIKKQSTVKSIDELLRKSEALVLVTPHREFTNMNLDKLKDSKIKLIIDGRNCLNKEKIQKLGIIYRGIGR